ncbi:MAG TPA: PEP-CTERM sorting domain-containing protein [Opitutaceae bacterium]
MCPAQLTLLSRGLGAAFALALATTAHAQVLMLDFGPTSPTGASTTNSPYHTAAGSSFTDGTWNVVGTADVTSGLLFSNNTAATGVSVNLGKSTTTTIALDSQPATSSALGSPTNTGVYSGTSVGTDGIFSGSNTSNNSIGLQIGGLAAGTYDIYVTARNTNTGSDATGNSQTVYLGSSSTSGNFDFGSYGSNASTLTYPTKSSATLYTASWVEGENYVKLSVTLSAGEFLNLAVDGTALGSGGDTRGFLNSVQIVSTGASPIPEPSTYAALAGAVVLGLVVLRRRRTP